MPRWERLAGGQSTFANGLLELRAFGFEEWRLRELARLAGFEWAVEARVELDAPCVKPATGLVIIDDGARSVRVTITDRAVVGATRVEIGRTDQLRTYRIESRGDAVQVLVDGKPVGSAAVADTGPSRAWHPTMRATTSSTGGPGRCSALAGSPRRTAPPLSASFANHRCA